MKNKTTNSLNCLIWLLNTSFNYRDFSEFIGVSVKELVKAIGESRTNGNGATTPETPKKLSRSSSPKNPQTNSPRFHNRSSSPVPIVGMFFNFSINYFFNLNFLFFRLFNFKLDLEFLTYPYGFGFFKIFIVNLKNIYFTRIIWKWKFVL